jgi:hypothetical protein
LKEEK